MGDKIRVDELAEAMMAELEEYVGLAPEAFEAAGKAAGKKAVKQLKNTSPGKGDYHKNWKVKTTKTRTGASTTIYQGKKPGLPHLLEYGHPIVRGGRTVGQAKAFPHIAAAQETAIKAYENELKERMENGT